MQIVHTIIFGGRETFLMSLVNTFGLINMSGILTREGFCQISPAGGNRPHGGRIGTPVELPFIHWISGSHFCQLCYPSIFGKISKELKLIPPPTPPPPLISSAIFAGIINSLFHWYIQAVVISKYAVCIALR